MAERDLAADDRAGFFARLRQLTPARIGLTRTGASIGTRDHLAFQAAHALARDAVHDALDVAALLEALHRVPLETGHVTSQAGDRQTYLARPDLGRRLNVTSRDTLGNLPKGREIAFVIADGLSARAIGSHAVPVLRELLPRLGGRSIGAAVVVEQGRVAIGDEIGALLEAALVCVFVGERPGLSSPDSLGIYLTFAPKVGRTDAERNCLSNIRPAGMGYAEAADRCAWLIDAAFARGLTGVALKDGSSAKARLIDAKWRE